MHERLGRWLHRPLLTATVVLCVALICYISGFKFLLVPIIIALNVLYMPVPAVLSGIVGRIFIGGLVASVVVQVAGMLQFMVAPRSHFMAVAILVVVVQMAFLAVVPKLRLQRIAAFTKIDATALVAAAIFLLPFANIFMGQESFMRILETGSFQVADAGHHYSNIIHVSTVQNLALTNYPLGFHFSLTFFQNSFVGKVGDASWLANLLLYFAHYILMGTLFMYALFMLAAGFVRALHKDGAALLNGWRTNVLLLLALAPVGMLLFALPLFSQGFLNYYYVLILMMAGILVLFDLPSKIDDAMRSWGILLFLLLGFGVAISWSLLLPLIIVIAALFFVPSKITWKNILQYAWQWQHLPIYVVVVLHGIFLFYQMSSISLSSDGMLNAAGNLHDLHYLLLGVGVILMYAVQRGRQNNDPMWQFVWNIMVPCYLFMGGLIMLQFITVGEARYYAIKVSIPVEVITVCLGAAILVQAVIARRLDGLRQIMAVVVVPLVAATLLLAHVPDPYRPIREIIKPAGGIPLPPHYDHDAHLLVKLGREGKLKHFNTIVLHTESKKLKGYVQLAYRANIMQQGSTPADLATRSCNDKVYAILDYGTGSAKEEKQAIKRLKTCIDLSHQRGLPYYIITDESAVPVMQGYFGDSAVIVH